MKIISFLKLLNRKIKKYDSYATNPFGKMPLSPLTIIWLEDISVKQDSVSSEKK